MKENKCTIKEFVDSCKFETSMTKKEKHAAVRDVFNALSELLVSHKGITIPGFGTFDVCGMAERDCRNPKTGETVKIEAHHKVVFRPCPELKKSVK